MKTYIFDLGKVVIQLTPKPFYNTWALYADEDPKILRERHRFYKDNNFKAFEKGQLTSHDFHQHFLKILGINITYNEFVEGWNSLFCGLYPDIVLALKRIKKKGHPLVALTNINVLHAHLIDTLYPTLNDLFDTIYKSYEIGFLKPELECYQYVLDHQKCDAQDCIFFDDKEENIFAAKSFGMDGVVVKDSEDVLKKLNEEGQFG